MPGEWNPERKDEHLRIEHRMLIAGERLSIRQAVHAVLDGASTHAACQAYDVHQTTVTRACMRYGLYTTDRLLKLHRTIASTAAEQVLDKITKPDHGLDAIGLATVGGISTDKVQRAEAKGSSPDAISYASAVGDVLERLMQQGGGSLSLTLSVESKEAIEVQAVEQHQSNDHE